jgi:hypothetical protein
MWLSHIFQKSQKIGKIEKKIISGVKKNGGGQGTAKLIEMVQYTLLF